MAGEWIKFEKSLPVKPEVMKMARILGIDVDAVVGKLMRLWVWTDSMTVDGVVDGVVDADVDAVCGQNGFGHACELVGWLQFHNNTERVIVTNFDRHNGESSKKRALKNNRIERRSEERRVGKECVSQCRSRGCREH